MYITKTKNTYIRTYTASTYVYIYVIPQYLDTYIFHLEIHTRKSRIQPRDRYGVQPDQTQNEEGRTDNGNGEWITVTVTVTENGCR